MSIITRTFAAACLAALPFPIAVAAAAQPQQPQAARVPRLPLRITENRGQWPAAVAAAVTGRDRSFFFTSGGVVVEITGADASGHAARHVLRLEFPGAAAVTPELESPLPGQTHYFRGARSEWKTGVRSFSRVRYRELWPGVDLTLTAADGAIKYALEARPGADASAAKLQFRGAAAVSLNSAGALRIETSAGALEDAAPVAWTERDGLRHAVPVAFQVEPGGVVHFAVGPRDASAPLTIDPTLPLKSSFLGGAGSDVARAVAIDGTGRLYIAGWTDSSEATFPAAVGPDTTFHAAGSGVNDAFIARTNPAGTALEYCGYVGGSGNDEALGVAVDASGRAYVCGFTTSSEAAGFPAASGPDATYNGGTNDAFIARVAADGASLEYCGYIGGSRNEQAYCVAVDAAGNAFVGGETNSDQFSFPVAVGPDVTYNGVSVPGLGFDNDAFICKVKSDGSALDYCGYIGSAGGFDTIRGVAVDSDGNCYVGGAADNSGTGFPAVVGPSLTPKGSLDGFVAKINPSGSSLIFCGFFGGSSQDFVSGLAIDAGRNIYVCGTTISNNMTTIVGPRLTFGQGTYDGFAAKIKANGTGFDFLGYVGGGGIDECSGIALDSHGNIYVSGDSSGGGLADDTGPLSQLHGISNIFVARILPSGALIDTCAYVGSSGIDSGGGVAVDAADHVYVVGEVGGSGAAATGGFGDVDAGGAEGYVAEIVVVPPTMDLVIKTGKAVDSPKDGKDTFTVTGTLAFNANSLDAVFDPATDDVTISMGDSVFPTTVVIPAGSPNWKSTNKNKHTWKSPAGDVPKVVFTWDVPKKKFTCKFTAFDFPEALANPLEVKIVAGNDDALNIDVWKNPKAGTFKLP